MPFVVFSLNLGSVCVSLGDCVVVVVSGGVGVVVGVVVVVVNFIVK